MNNNNNNLNHGIEKASKVSRLFVVLFKNKNINILPQTVNHSTHIKKS